MTNFIIAKPDQITKIFADHKVELINDSLRVLTLNLPSGTVRIESNYDSLRVSIPKTEEKWRMTSEVAGNDLVLFFEYESEAEDFARRLGTSYVIEEVSVEV